MYLFPSYSLNFVSEMVLLNGIKADYPLRLYFGAISTFLIIRELHIVKVV